jgi:hypothetical protein
MGRLALAVPVMLLLLCTTCRLTLGITDGNVVDLDSLSLFACDPWCLPLDEASWRDV